MSQVKLRDSAFSFQIEETAVFQLKTRGREGVLNQPQNRNLFYSGQEGQNIYQTSSESRNTRLYQYIALSLSKVARAQSK